MTEHIEGTFEGVKGLKIYYQAWIPEAPKAVVQFVHGVTEHSGLFPHLVKELISNGYAMYADESDFKEYAEAAGQVFSN